MLKRAAVIAALSFLISPRLEAQSQLGDGRHSAAVPIWPNAQTAPDGVPQYPGDALGQLLRGTQDLP